MLAHADAVLADPTLAADVTAFAERIAPYARVNSLGQKLVQLTMPGVPDVYQGCELAGLSLVDPDNRRPVDYARRRELLAALDAGTVPADLDGEKLLVTSRALRLRREHPDWFAGEYGRWRADRARRRARAGVPARRRVVVATRLPAGLERRGGWERHARRAARRPVAGRAHRPVVRPGRRAERAARPCCRSRCSSSRT